MRLGSILAVLVVAAAVLAATAWLRGAEYDEQYTLFLTGGVARPIWPFHDFASGEVRALQAGHAGFVSIAHDLRSGDVHPPLYFWAVAVWRWLVGDGLFAARLFSVLCGVASLGLVAAIARQVGIRPVMAMLLTLGCYGFAYTSVVARGFALAQVLTLAGVALLLAAKARGGRWSAVAAGMLMGAATFANYLAVFVGCAALVWVFVRSRTQTPSPTLPRFAGEGVLVDSLSREAGEGWGGGALFGFALWLPADLWFFLAQRQSRAGQFPPFELLPSLARLARYFSANLFGGLPLYVSGTASRIIATALAALLVALLALLACRWRGIGTPATRLLLAMCGVAPPLGLVLLGIAFNNTPIELRYLAFATPFIALLLATLPRPVCCVVLAIQAVSVVGLMKRPETMQPAHATAVAAAALVGGGVVLVPHGNDGVGIVGAFAIEAPPTLRLLVIGRDQSPSQISERVGRYSRVVLALLGQDTDSRATLPAMREAFAAPCWRPAGEGYDVLAFERVEGACVRKTGSQTGRTSPAQRSRT